MRARSTSPDHAKANGVHYTPPIVAKYLADVTAASARLLAGPIRVLDPACGDGGLLSAIARAVPSTVRARMILEGYETNAPELAKAKESLRGLGARDIVLHKRDFLSVDAFDNLSSRPDPFDIVIANPPYVRTQVMGAKKAQALAKRFGLSGRIDLYHAFAIGMAGVLKPGGVIGLLTSNRFLTTKSGASLRELFASRFDMQAIYDLGDTKLFSAAVLPVIIVARKGKTESGRNCAFHRIYEHRRRIETPPAQCDSALEALRDAQLVGVVQTPSGTFHVERGNLAVQAGIWSLANAGTTAWLEAVARKQSATFGDLAKVRVGVKSTADDVFVRDDWHRLPRNIQPEANLIKPLITHREATRWIPKPLHVARILYPHVTENGRQRPIRLADFPRAAAYFEQHRARLTRRQYVIDAGRRWYEIWVPHNPDDWAKPKVAYPDISEHPKFFFDASGAIVQGDCYWITLNDGVNHEWLLLMLAVANSTFITAYYDVVFHNKLYAGRRRFMTQYVAKFPLPDLHTPVCRRLLGEVSKLLKAGQATEQAERTINRLVWESIGLTGEIPWQWIHEGMAR